MEIHLPDDIEPFVAECVASGRYRSPSDVVMLGLYLLRDQEYLNAAKLAALRADIQSGIDQADRGEMIPAEEVWAELDALSRRHMDGAA